jgi:arylsulfatase
MSQRDRDPTVVPEEPHWPSPTRPPEGSPNIVVILFDDVGFSDFGCYGSPIDTPAIDALAARGVRYSGFHTTAMCSTTRASLLTGRNHHSVGVGCLANFDSGYPGYRGKISKDSSTLAEMLRPHGYNNYMVGKWHVTPLSETGPTGPVDGWPLARGFDRFYGFMDAETDQYSPELVRDNSPVPPPGSYESGYHLTEDLTDQAIRYIADHVAADPESPFMLWLAFGACHGPHQAPAELVMKYDAKFAGGWDQERDQRLARQIESGMVPVGTALPPRNDFVQAWDGHDEDEQRVFARLQGAFAAMLDHADQNIARLTAFLETLGLTDDTLVLVLSDNGASQEGLMHGFVNGMGPYNQRPESMTEKLARIDDIGGPATHSNYPMGWAMASNTPLKRYKQNTHGGGIRDPLIVSWPGRVPTSGEIRHQLAHVCDIVPTILELIGLDAPATVNGATQKPLEGVSFAASLDDPNAPSKDTPQYFEMFGHRGIIHQGWKAVAYHAPGSSFTQDSWELYNLAEDFAETADLAKAEPERLDGLIDLWWQEAEAHQVLPIDDRFIQRFSENAVRRSGSRTRFVFHKGMGHLPSDVTPDLRSRSYRIDADISTEAGDSGVLIAHGDGVCGYSFYIEDGLLVHDTNVGTHQIMRSTLPVPAGDHLVSFLFEYGQAGSTGTLLIDGEAVGTEPIQYCFVSFISWSGLNIGRDPGAPVSAYAAPNAFTGLLRKVTITLDPDQNADDASTAEALLARE